MLQEIENPVIEATQVTDEKRLSTLPRYFGRYVSVFENEVYAQMSRLCADYEGGYWTFYELSNDGFYMAVDRAEKMQIVNSNNLFEQSVSADTAGIIACLFALNNVVWQYEGNSDIYKLYELFERLKDYAAQHEDSKIIFSAID